VFPSAKLSNALKIDAGVCQCHGPVAFFSVSIAELGKLMSFDHVFVPLWRIAEACERSKHHADQPATPRHLRPIAALGKRGFLAVKAAFQ